MHNDFSGETRSLFIFNYSCWVCGRNKWDALHHIVGRGYGDSKCEQSPLNAAPICNYPCHIGQALHSDETQKDFLQRTKNYLLIQGYKLTELDNEFMEKYKQYY